MFWLSAFIDVPADPFEETVAFWSAVTGWSPSARRGADDEFLTLEPAGDADDHVRMQRLASGEARIHLDVHVPDPRAEADRAVALGATEVADQGYVVLESPGGLTFCLVTHPASRPAPPSRWPDLSTSLVDQVCLDVPAIDVRRGDRLLAGAARLGAGGVVVPRVRAPRPARRPGPADPAPAPRRRGRAHPRPPRRGVQLAGPRGRPARLAGRSARRRARGVDRDGRPGGAALLPHRPVAAVTGPAGDPGGRLPWTWGDLTGTDGPLRRPRAGAARRARRRGRGPAGRRVALGAPAPGGAVQLRPRRQPRAPQPAHADARAGGVRAGRAVQHLHGARGRSRAVRGAGDHPGRRGADVRSGADGLPGRLRPPRRRRRCAATSSCPGPRPRACGRPP